MAKEPEQKAWQFDNVDDLLAAHQPGLLAFERYNDEGEIAEYWLASSQAEFLKAARPIYKRIPSRNLDTLRRKRFSDLVLQKHKSGE